MNQGVLTTTPYLAWYDGAWSASASQDNSLGALWCHVRVRWRLVYHGVTCVWRRTCMIISGLGTWPGSRRCRDVASPLVWKQTVTASCKLEPSGDTLAVRHKITGQVQRYRNVLCGTEHKNVFAKYNFSEKQAGLPCRRGIASPRSSPVCRFPSCRRWLLQDRTTVYFVRDTKNAQLVSLSPTPTQKHENISGSSRMTVTERRSVLGTGTRSPKVSCVRLAGSRHVGWSSNKCSWDTWRPYPPRADASTFRLGRNSLFPRMPTSCPRCHHMRRPFAGETVVAAEAVVGI